MNLSKSDDADLAGRVVRFLKGLDCCDSCVLRYLGFKVVTRIYERTPSEVHQKVLSLIGKLESGDDGVALPTKKLSTNNCSTCLGILQNGCGPDELIKVANGIESDGFKFQSFSLMISVPVTTTLRNQILLSKLEAAFPDHSHYQPDFVTSVKDVWRVRLSQYICQTFPGVTEDEHAPFAISVSASHQNVNMECKPIFDKCPSLLKVVQCRKSMSATLNGPQTFNHYNHTALVRAIDKLGDEYFAKLSLEGPSNSFQLDGIICTMDSIFVGGRYNKFSRRVSQTPWIIDGVKLAVSSIQDEIGDSILSFIPADGIKFSAAGREDVDVRMLGRGRPFMVEVLNPRSRELPDDIFARIEREINSKTSDVAVRDLQLSSRKEVQLHIKEGQEEKKKCYAAYCCANRPLTKEDVANVEKLGKNVMIKQQTPIRVLHRRSLATRKRTIESVTIELDETDNHCFTAVLVTEAGTYVKEFIHSDFGRTNPSLATLVGDCRMDIMHLDVTDVFLDWPPSVPRSASLQ